MRTFRVRWADGPRNGEVVTPAEMQEIALREPWAQRLLYCDIEGFAVGDEGNLYLLDECGNFSYVPEGLFVVDWG